MNTLASKYEWVFETDTGSFTTARLAPYLVVAPLVYMALTLLLAQAQAHFHL
jgi:hypothetical protein